MDELIKAMSVVELERFKKQYAKNESIIKIVDGYIAIKAKEAEQAKAKEVFVHGIVAMSEQLPHPDDVANIYMAWREVEVADISQPQVEVEIVTTPAELDKDGRIVKQAVIAKEMRYPMAKVSKWVVELNKGFAVSKGSQAPTTANKRAITVSKRDGNSLMPVGNFTSASKACDHLKLPIGGDSATRVLARNSYILDQYNGTDFLK